ncbi:hypothetical protein Acr_00g0004860 [Actinidia rufa]|uniref:Uncharacterized protein n=1 Tax=Actinidia rufa TaxID=165716 RepID=A0A7J0D7J8_9ERIC|nr:hypothetical protein Acr_00g0004860 [Actinidia rufa]
MRAYGWFHFMKAMRDGEERASIGLLPPNWQVTDPIYMRMYVCNYSDVDKGF